ncbi:MAG: hypothetical protein GY943_28700 [Chloroflexi bacterium]|nr:hypothetical protein [Chloroflexota bacterium]
MAPDSFIMRAGRGLAYSEKWQLLAYNDEFVWGNFPNLKHNDIQTLISRHDMTVACTCSSRKFPCRHGMALLLLMGQRPFLFSRLIPEGWIANRQTRHRQEQQRKRQVAAQTPPLPTRKSEQKRFQHLQTGIAELELWLQDLVRHGLAALPDRSKTFWTEIASRMVDAEAPEIAHRLRHMSAIPTKQSDWPEQYLKQLGIFFLLVKGFNAWESHTPETQVDLKTAVGWHPPPFTEIGERIEDDWLVLGRLTRPVSTRNWHTTWVWGINSNRAAAFLQILPTQRPTGVALATNAYLRGTLHFDKSHWPLFAHAATLKQVKRPLSPQIGFTSISTAIATFTDAIAVRPWINQFPMLLQNVKLWQSADTVFLIDAEGHLLPLTTPFLYRWHLEAFSANKPLTLFGIWNGRFFTPISLNTHEGWTDLHMLRGVK